jgi:hypothetical protein
VGTGLWRTQSCYHALTTFATWLRILGHPLVYQSAWLCLADVFVHPVLEETQQQHLQQGVVQSNEVHKALVAQATQKVRVVSASQTPPNATLTLSLVLEHRSAEQARACLRGMRVLLHFLRQNERAV